MASRNVFIEKTCFNQKCQKRYQHQSYNARFCSQPCAVEHMNTKLKEKSERETASIRTAREMATRFRPPVFAT